MEFNESKRNIMKEYFKNFICNSNNTRVDWEGHSEFNKKGCFVYNLKLSELWHIPIVNIFFYKNYYFSNRQKTTISVHETNRQTLI